MAEACVFCRIARDEIPAQRLYEDEALVIIRDIAPVAPSHLLVIPRVHIASLNEITEQESSLLGAMTLAALRLAQRQGLTVRGYRLVLNCGSDAGQSVEHVHLHVLGGRQLGPIG